MKPVEANPTAERTPDTARMWNEREAAQFLGVSPAFLEADRRRVRRIPYVKIGRAVRYDPADVIAFKDRSKVPAQP